VTINSVRRVLYVVARILGDINAVRRGPKAMVKRFVRKAVLKEVGKVLR
jgi:hypothetical protein